MVSGIMEQQECRKGGWDLRKLIGLLFAVAAGTAFGGQAPPSFPAQQRPPGDPALIERGGALYGTYCRACHGTDLRGGDLGGPNLLRSELVLGDRQGETIGPVIRDGVVPQGGGTAMPPLPLPDADIRAMAEYIHNIARQMQSQGAPPRQQIELDLLVGDARAGQRYFQSECAACHSPAGDLAGIGSRVTDIEQLQVNWVSGRRLRAGWGGAASGPSPRRVTVRFEDGTVQEGVLARLDDFHLSFTTDAGRHHSYMRRSATPRIVSVDVHDPLKAHRDLWLRLEDKDMHDVTAYLATLK